MTVTTHTPLLRSPMPSVAPQALPLPDIAVLPAPDPSDLTQLSVADAMPDSSVIVA